MTNEHTAIVLAGTIPHIRLIEILKARGFYVILIDYHRNPPARIVADEHMQVSTLDQNKVLDIAERVGAKFVISTCMDHANVTACYVAENLGLPAPYSYKTALSVTNKCLMKEKMIRHGIPTSKFISVEDIREFESSGLRFPLIVKPVDRNGSKGVRKVSNSHDLTHSLEIALQVSQSGRAIIEEYIEGTEIGVDCYIENRNAVILMTKERRKIKKSSDPIQQIEGCLWPSDLAKENLPKLKEIAENIAQAFDLDNTPLMMQVIIKGNEINVIEFAARFGGGESFRIIQLCAGLDIIKLAIDSFLRLPVNLNHKISDYYYADTFIYAHPAVFGSIEGFQELLENHTVDYVDTYYSKGMKIGRELTSNNRIGVFVVKSNNIEQLYDRIRTAIDSIDVYDINGETIMRKEIYSA